MKQEKLEELVNSGVGMPVMAPKEARELGLMFYWTGNPCLHGHNSKRRTVTHACIACLYITNSARDHSKLPTLKARKDEQQRQATEYVIGNRQRQKVLETYAETGDLEKAAKSIKLTVPQLNVQLTKCEKFTAQLNVLEKRFRLAKTAQHENYVPKDMVWSKEDHKTFIRAYVDTGDMATARDSVGASPSNYFDEIENNLDFAEMVRDAEPKAIQALEEKAIQLARAGNDKLLTLVLKAKKPEYKDKIQIDQTNTTFVKISDDTLSSRIMSLLNKHRVIDGEFEDSSTGRLATPNFVPIEPTGERDPISLLGGIGSTQDREQVRVLLSSDGTSESRSLQKAS